MPIDRTNPGQRVHAHQQSGRGVARVPYPIEVRRLEVRRTQLVTPRMLRVTLGGPELAGLHTYAADDHVRVVFAREDGTRADPVPNDRLTLDWPRPIPPSRQYTIRRYDEAAREIDLDVVIHDGGLASSWAQAALPTDPVVIAGPPVAKPFAHTYRHYIFAIDTTALPALARWLDEADWLERSEATATVVIDYDEVAETQYPLTKRAGVDVHWSDRTGGSQLAHEVIAHAHPPGAPGETFVFAAGEAGDLKPVRSWARTQGHDVLVTGYWKRGASGDLDSA